jgi:hypothetical protein
MVTHVKDIIKNVMGQGPQSENSWQMYLLSNWNTIIGNLRTKVKLEKIQDDTIVLGVYDSSWMQELYCLSNVLIHTINSKLDKPRIKKIKFKKAEHIKSKKLEILPMKTIKKIELNFSEISALKNIKDKELSDALKNFLIRCHNQR